MSRRRALRWIAPMAGILIVLSGYIAYFGWNAAPYEDCVRLKRAFESNTQNHTVLNRLNTECPGWEADY